jgi:hypothetical protein
VVLPDPEVWLIVDLIGGLIVLMLTIGLVAEIINWLR